ncbi:MAG TPA: hypothetical protein DCY13_11830, partial [Verrucomicrobiales bacterium]|nr:hypothetical protein [Verrucomicrobiales bacterium]
FRDRLVGLEDDSMRAEYRYDFTGRRILKRVHWKQGEPGQQPTAPGAASAATSYPGRHFEVREHDQPVKYVFNGDSRVAKITGSLSASRRVQRLRLHIGWNLVSFAVEGASFPLLDPVIGSALRWDLVSGRFVAVAPGEVIPAGTVLWIRAVADAWLAITGASREPAAISAPAGERFVAVPGLLAWPVNRPESVTVWRFEAGTGRWSAALAGLPMIPPDLPSTLAPGEAIFIRSDQPAELTMPDPALQILYYHEDHLGSSSTVTDATGKLVEETAHHPFGGIRHVHRLSDVAAHYGFTRKERDRESGLHYLEARYLAGALARFATADPKYAGGGGSDAGVAALVGRPAMLNPYAYVQNNPVRYHDPSGLDGVDAVGNVSDAAGIAAGASEEVALIRYARTGAKASEAASTVAGVVGKTTAVISVAIKGTQFINDPNANTGGQLLNEGAKTLTGIVAAPVGLVWAALDLAGYGPSAILEHTEKSIQYNREATRHYNAAAESWKEAARTYNEGAQRVGAKMNQMRPKVAQLQQASQKLVKQYQQLDRDMAAEIKRLEGEIKQQKRELRYWNQRAREASK